MCDCVKVSYTETKKEVSCREVRVATLDIYLAQVECAITTGKYAAATTTEAECRKAKEILEAWRDSKLKDSNSCEYHNYLPIMQNLIKRIILSGICS